MWFILAVLNQARKGGNKDAILLYLNNCALLLLLVSGSITWHQSSQHLHRTSWYPPAERHTLQNTPHQHSAFSSDFWAPLFVQCSTYANLCLYLLSHWALLPPCHFFSVPPSHPALDILSVFCWVWLCDFGMYKNSYFTTLIKCVSTYVNNCAQKQIVFSD